MIDNIFGTDGIRAKVGTYPFTVNALHLLGKAIALWSLQKYNKKPSFLLGHDTRISCDFVKSSLKSGLLLYPIVIHDGHVLTSPAVCNIITTQQKKFDCGIIISASHNPFQDNGIKVIDAIQGKLSLEDELIISNIFHMAIQEDTYTNLGTEINWPQAEDAYRSSLQTFFKTNFLQGKKVVLDCAHGAAYHIAPTIFRDYGATTIALNNQPNGININHKCGALHPDALQKAVIAYNADVGFAFDGDADRVVMVNNRGEVHDGDDILALLLKHPLYEHTNEVVGTIMTNQGFQFYLQKLGKNLIRTSVGDKYIAALLLEKNLLLGGEPSGHIIARDYLPTGDGIFIALRILETITINQNLEMKSFVKFPQIIINIPISFKKDLTILPYAQLITESQDSLMQGRLIVRYSGTEQLLRIMIEDSDYNHAHTIAQTLAQELSKALN